MSAGTATVTLQPATAGTAIDLGTETIGKLSLTDAELDRITARTIVIGNDESGPITISAPLNHPATNTLALIGNTTFAANSGYTFQIGGTTAGTQHDQITVMGTLTIDSTAAFATTAANSFVPSAGLSFTLINNDTAADAVMGAFQNLPEGSVLTNFLGAGQAASLTYRGADGNDVVVLTTLEYGDAPAPYPTTLAADGARHIPFGPTLGSLRDVESDGALSTLADGDDNAETDDEDGITFRATIVADASVTTRASVEVDLQSADPDGNFLDGFLDLNGDGDWTDAGEHIIDDVNLGTTDGLYVVTFTIPVDVGPMWSRARPSLGSV